VRLGIAATALYPTDPSLRTVRTGNTVRVYNGSGQLTMTVNQKR